jgi:hypothetical protein
MANEIYEDLRLTAVGCPSEVTLPSFKFVFEVLSQQLRDIGMSGEELDSEITNTFVLRERNESDPQYSLDSLKESETDILGLYLTNQSRQPEIRLFVDSCSRACTDLFVSIDDLLQIELIHELAHHATGCAEIVDECRSIYRWTDYDRCGGDRWPSVHEFFAQALSFVWIAKDRKELLGPLRTLSRYQPSIYRTWEVFDAFTQNKVSLDSIRKTLQAQFLALMKSCGQRRLPQHHELHLDPGDAVD